MTYSHEAKCTFAIASWSESAFVDIDGTGTTMGENYYPERGLTCAEVAYTYTGEMEGVSTLRYLNAYAPGDAPVLGLEQFEGSIGGHEGTCVFQHVGSHDAHSVTAHLQIVPGMGTGGLETLRGEADLEIAGESADGYALVLAYDIG